MAPETPPKTQPPPARAAGPGTSQDVPEGVALCRTSPILPDVPPSVVAFIPQAMIMLAILGMFGWLALEQFVLVPIEVRVAVLTLAAIGVLWLLGREVVRAYQRGISIAPVPHKPDAAARINIALYADQLPKLLPLREDEVFEPEVFWTFRPSVPSTPWKQEAPAPGDAERSTFWSRANPWWVLVLVAWITTMQFVPSGWVQNTVVLAAGVVVLAVLFRRPTHLRVVPGRVDIMRQPTLGLSWGLGLRPSVESIDLRGSRVLVDLRSGQVILDPVYDPFPGPLATDAQRDEHQARMARQRLLNFGMTIHREAAMLAIARAAASSAEPPPLPEDRFTD